MAYEHKQLKTSEALIKFTAPGALKDALQLLANERNIPDITEYR